MPKIIKGLALVAAAVAALEHLPAYATVMWRDPGAVAKDERSQAVVGSNTYLRALFSTAAATTR